MLANRAVTFQIAQIVRAILVDGPEVGAPPSKLRRPYERVIALFRDELHYRYLGDWSDRDANTNIEEAILTEYLTQSGHTPPQISQAIYKIRTEANHPSP